MLKNSIASIIYSQNLYVQILEILEMLEINNRSDQKKFAC